MTPQEQREAIAEACGWRFQDHVKASDKSFATMCWIRPGNAEWQPEELPDYINDLNAMHEAEKVLVTEKECFCYAVRIAELVKGFPNDSFEGVSSYIWHATAAQRAEAFLKTIGKWKS